MEHNELGLHEKKIILKILHLFSFETIMIAILKNVFRRNIITVYLLFSYEMIAHKRIYSYLLADRCA